MAILENRNKKEEVLQALDGIRKKIESYSEDEIQEFHANLVRGRMPDPVNSNYGMVAEKWDGSTHIEISISLQKKIQWTQENLD